ncbi:unnamed protein product [Rhizoctonia solani]|uniref:Jacalin-type lectin domain-containing protein n=1 Tax=Rhizoctonia solani TaxID=456999 RepID=A0A8H3CGC6_9AGAM|nr:unnamed protein product [Rhizoctonia solani]
MSQSNTGQPRGGNRSRGSAQLLYQGGNNNLYPLDWVEGSRNETSYSQLDENARESFLHSKGYLFGVRIDSNDGPRSSPRQVARHTTGLSHRIQETNNIDSEVITTDSVRDTNYVHKGWSLSALSGVSPWTISRIARNNQAIPTSRSITKYVVVQKLRVDLSTDDIAPVPELEEEFRVALGQPTLFEKSQAVYRVFEHWGDVIPMVFDIGVSLAVTDSEEVAKKYLTKQSYLGLQQLSISASARASTQGGDPTALQTEDNIRTWLRKSVPICQWEQVRIVGALPLTSILNNELQYELTELHQSLTTYCPTITNAITSDGASFDGSSHAFKTITNVSIFSDGYHIKALSVKYTTETTPVKYGGGQKPNNQFDLALGEHITDMILWKDSKGVCGIQMNTSKGKTSTHFGSDGGSPTIMRSAGGCLAGFSGIFQADKLHDLQTIWRHNVQGSGLGGDREFSQYYGGVGGTPFSDWPFVRHSDSARIQSVQVKCGTYIDGIQISYADTGPRGRGLVSKQANYHGGSGGKECSFDLESNEHIVAVLGRYNKYIVQLCFVTNRGRTSDIFGGGDGQDFRCQAPKTSDGRATRLHYICGKSGDWLNGILLIWSPL